MNFNGLQCANCDQGLTGKQRQWCSPECAKAGARTKRLSTVFNITTEEYDLILEFQGGVCAICGRPPKPGKRLAVDHDHVTGFVRGLLDFFCNRRLISSRSDEAILAAAKYVTNPPARRALGRDVVAPGRPPKKRHPRTTRATRSASKTSKNSATTRKKAPR